MKNKFDIKFYLKEYSWLLILLAIIFGLKWSGPGMVIKPYISYLLMGLMFLSCVNIDFARSLGHLKKVRKIVVSLLVIHILSVLVIWFFRNQFDHEIFLGLVIAAVAPVGISVIFLSKLYGGSTAKSLVITVLSNVLSLLIVPLMVFLLAHEEVLVNPWQMGWTIFKLILVPIMLARLAERTFLKGSIERNGTYISIVILFLLIWGSIAPVGQVLVYDLVLLKVLMVVLMSVLANICLGLWLGSDWKAKKTYAISLSYKNFTLAMVIALTLFGPEVAMPAAVYTLVNNLMLVPLQWMWSSDK